MSSYTQAGSSTLSRVSPTPGAFPTEPDSPTIISSQQSLSQAVHARRAEYTKPHRTRVKVGTWNVAAKSGTNLDIADWFVKGKGVSETLSGLSINPEKDSGKEDNGSNTNAVKIESVAEQEERRTKKRSTVPKNDPGLLPGGEDIGIYVLGLQEIVDITSATEALRPYTDPHPSRKWKRAIADALPEGYQLVVEQQLIGLLLLVYASSSIAPTISSVSTTSVGTGLMGYMGNKGAVTARVVLGGTTRIVFVNCHLAAGIEKSCVERRNWDASQVLIRTRFDPVDDGDGVGEEFSEGIGNEDFAFWFGDLNYRIADLPGDDVRRLLMLHTRNEYDTRQRSAIKIDDELGILATSKGAKDTAMLPIGEQIDPASDPASLQTTLSSLLPHDELYQQMRTRKAFHDGWQEGPVEFLPTYKYDVGSVGMFDSSEKKRGPSWCDRILYRTRKDKIEYERKVDEEDEAKRRDEEMKSRGLDKSSDDEVLYDYDPETDGADDGYDDQTNGVRDSDVVTTRSGFEDRLHLDYYTSHQRVLSSDHKPLDAVFTLDYDAVDSVVKAEIQQEVARELDKAENEGRPVITMVVDHHHSHSSDPDNGIDFGHVRYGEEKTRNMTIANTGRVTARFGFVDRPGSQGNSGGISPAWLDIRFDRSTNNENLNPSAPNEYTLEPGEAVNVRFALRISDMDQVRSLNDGRSKIEDVLVLRIHNGRDHFVPIKGTWLQSSFGRSIDKLIRLPEGGVRRLQHQRPGGSSHGEEDNSVKWSAPREVFRLTEKLEELVERTLAEWGMKEENSEPPWDALGWPFTKGLSALPEKEHQKLKMVLQESLDTDQDFTFPHDIMTPQKVELLGEVLCQFLQSLEDGVVTEGLWSDLEKGLQEMEKLKTAPGAEEKRSWILDILSASPTHSVTFTFLTFMLASMANELAPLPSMPTTPATPRTPDALLGDSWARGRSQEPAVVRRKAVERRFAEILAPVMIKAPLPVKAKERKVSEDRRREVIEVFLRSKWEERSS